MRSPRARWRRSGAAAGDRLARPGRPSARRSCARRAGSGPRGRPAPSAAAPCAAAVPGTARANARASPPSRQRASPPSRPSAASLLPAGTPDRPGGGRVVLGAAGTTAAAVGYDKMAGNGVLYQGLQVLGGGSILAGLVLGAIGVFVIDRKFMSAAAFALAGAVLTYFGFMHGEAIGIGNALGVTPGVTLAYAAVAAFLFGCARYGEVRPLHETEALDDHGALAQPAE